MKGPASDAGPLRGGHGDRVRALSSLRRVEWSRAVRVAFLTAALPLWMPLVSPAAPAPAKCWMVRETFEIREAGGVPLRQPSDILVHENLLYVLDDLNGRVAVYDLGGRFKRAVKTPGGREVSYLGMGLGGADRIFLADSGGGRVLVTDLQGHVVKEFETGEGDEPSRPVGILVSRGECYVVDSAAHQIRVFDLKGQPLRRWGELGEGPQGLRYPFRVVQDDPGRIIVADTLNSRIQIFTPKGNPLLTFGEFGVSEGTLFRPAGLAVLAEDLLLVGDNYLGSLQVFDFQGRYQGVLCGQDQQPLVLKNPVSLAVRDQIIFVLEMGKSRVKGLEIIR